MTGDSVEDRTRGYSLFDTGIGRCGVAWGEHGLLAVQLPELSDGETVARLTEGLPDAQEMTPGNEVQEAIEKMVALLDGKATDLSTTELDMTGVPPFPSPGVPNGSGHPTGQDGVVR